MLDFTKLKVDDIRRMINEEFEIPLDEIVVKGKTNLVNLYKSLEQIGGDKLVEVNTAEMEEVVDEPEVEIEIDSFEEEIGIIDHETGGKVDFNEKTISRSDAGWSEYVLQHLAHDEVDNGVPKTDALKRLIEDMVGTVISIDNEVVQAPSPENGRTAVVKSNVTVMPYVGDHALTYTGCADAVAAFIADPFCRFLTAIAETRAEGRAYRKILALKNVVTTDEILGTDQTNADATAEITDQNVTYIDLMCGQIRGYNLNVKQLFHKTTGKEYNSIYKYSAEDSDAVMAVLRSCQKDMKVRPEGIDGYDANWKNYFA